MANNITRIKSKTRDRKFLGNLYLGGVLRKKKIPEMKKGESKTTNKIKFFGYEKTRLEIIVVREMNTSPKKKITATFGYFSLPNSRFQIKRPTPIDEDKINNNVGIKDKSLKRKFMLSKS